MEEGAGSKDAVQRSALADASTAVLFSASGSFASEVVAVERLASLPRPDEGQLVAGANVYVRSHGPARLVSAPSPAGFCQVEYPDSSTDEVPKEAILFTQETPSSPYFSRRTLRSSSNAGLGICSPEGRSSRLEFLGTAFDAPSRQTSTASAVRRIPLLSLR
ncbi:unnamed protein product, partial [Polarella glacialis]